MPNTRKESLSVPISETKTRPSIKCYRQEIHGKSELKFLKYRLFGGR